MFCRKCGIDNPDGARYCRRCGEPLTGARTSTGGTTSVPPTSGKMTVEDLPVEYRPIGMWGYFGYSLLFAIPFVGWIIALVFAFGVNPNINLKNFARAYFCSLIVALSLIHI